MNTLALLEVAVGRSREEMNALALIERRHRHAWSPSGGRGRVDREQIATVGQPPRLQHVPPRLRRAATAPRVTNPSGTRARYFDHAHHLACSGGIHHERAHRAAMTSLEEDHARERRAISRSAATTSAVAAATQSIVDADLARFKDPTVEGSGARRPDIHKYIMRLPIERADDSDDDDEGSYRRPEPAGQRVYLAATLETVQELQRERASLVRQLEDVNERIAAERRSPSIEKNRPYVAFRHVPAQHAGPDAWRAYKRSLPHSMQQRKVTAGSR